MFNDQVTNITFKLDFYRKIGSTLILELYTYYYLLQKSIYCLSLKRVYTFNKLYPEIYAKIFAEFSLKKKQDRHILLTLKTLFLLNLIDVIYCFFSKPTKHQNFFYSY